METNHRPLVRLAPLAVCGLLMAVASCGDADPVGVPVGAPSSTDSTTTTDSTTLPGDPFDPVYMPAGAELGAVAVPFDETLDERALPGGTETVLSSLPPLASGIVSTGQARILGVRDVWLEVTASGTSGWVPLLNVLYVGGSRDSTAEFVDRLGGAPTAPSMLELGRIVAESIASTDSDIPSRIVVVVAPTDGATGEVTYDVVDFPDDSIGGARLRIVGRQVQAPGDSLPPTRLRSATAYELVSVETTALCLRGTSDGICV